jgi:hypothetical protein
LRAADPAKACQRFRDRILSAGLDRSLKH